MERERERNVDARGTHQLIARTHPNGGVGSEPANQAHDALTTEHHGPGLDHHFFSGILFSPHETS